MSTEKITFEFDVVRTPAHPDLEFVVLLDGKTVHELAADSHHVKIELNDEDAKHQVVLELVGKRDIHTRINEQGEIVADAVVAVSNLVIDGIDVTDVFFAQSKYRHNFNGNGDAVVDKFYGTMGCNGTVSFDFSTPIYLWLLENM